MSPCISLQDVVAAQERIADQLYATPCLLSRTLSKLTGAQLYIKFENLPEETARGLADVAATLDRPKAYVVQKALDSYLAEFADYQIALDRLNDKDDAIFVAARRRARRASIRRLASART